MTRAGRLGTVLIAALLLAACGDSSRRGADSGSGGKSLPNTIVGETNSRTKSPEERCGSPHYPARVIRFEASDGTPLYGALVGHGHAGLVLTHQYPGSVCDWWAFSAHAAKRGFEALIFDFRCFGESACPSARRGFLVSDISGAVARLRADGVRKVFLAGASLGATTSLIAATKVTPPVAGVVGLSAETNLRNLAGVGPPLNALKAAPRLKVPVLLAASRGDIGSQPSDARLLLERSPSDDKRLLVEPPSYAHGTAMLQHPGLDWSPVADAIIRFSRSHS